MSKRISRAHAELLQPGDRVSSAENILYAMSPTELEALAIRIVHEASQNGRDNCASWLIDADDKPIAGDDEDDLITALTYALKAILLD